VPGRREESAQFPGVPCFRGAIPVTSGAAHGAWVPSDSGMLLPDAPPTVDSVDMLLILGGSSARELTGRDAALLVERAEAEADQPSRMTQGLRADLT
jgi:hypothetical protein